MLAKSMKSALRLHRSCEHLTAEKEFYFFPRGILIKYTKIPAGAGLQQTRSEKHTTYKSIVINTKKRWITFTSNPTLLSHDPDTIFSGFSCLTRACFSHALLFQRKNIIIPRVHSSAAIASQIPTKPRSS